MWREFFFVILCIIVFFRSLWLRWVLGKVKDWVNIVRVGRILLRFLVRKVEEVWV